MAQLLKLTREALQREVILHKAGLRTGTVHFPTAVRKAVYKTVAPRLADIPPKPVTPKAPIVIAPALPFGMFGDIIPILRPTITLEPTNGEYQAVPTMSWGMPKPETHLTIIPVTPFGATEPVMGEDVPKEDVPFIKEVVDIIPKVPEVPDILGGLGKTLLIAGLALGGLYLVGKLIGRK